MLALSLDICFLGRLEEEQAEMPPNINAPARGIVSQPSMSASLIIAETRPVGSMIWMEDGQQIWALAKVVSQANTILNVRRETGKEAEIDLVRTTDGKRGKAGYINRLPLVHAPIPCMRRPRVLLVAFLHQCTYSVCLLLFCFTYTRCSLSHSSTSYVDMPIVASLWADYGARDKPQT